MDAVETERPGAVLLGNVIVKRATEPGNRGAIRFGQDGGRGHEGTFYLVHNTIVTPLTSPVVDLSSTGARPVLIGNVIDDGGRLRSNQVLRDGRRGGASTGHISGSHDWLAPGFGNRLEQTALTAVNNTVADTSQQLFVTPRDHDYRPRGPWPGIAGAGDARLLDALPATPGARDAAPPLIQQYEQPLRGAKRPASERPDLGAHAIIRP